MTTMNSVLDMQSSHTELGKQIVSSVVDKLIEGRLPMPSITSARILSSTTTRWDSSSTTKHG